jgi:type VI secretion system protein VasD
MTLSNDIKAYKGDFMCNTYLTTALLGAFLTACSSSPEPIKPALPPIPEALVQTEKSVLPVITPSVQEEPKITEIDALLTVSKQINPDIYGRPSPVVMRIYELKNIGKFEAADFYKITGTYETLLGTDLVSSEQFHLHPGQTKSLKQAISPETKYIAVTVAYRDLNKAVWRATVPIEANKISRFEIILEKLKVSIKQ